MVELEILKPYFLHHFYFFLNILFIQLLIYNFNK